MTKLSVASMANARLAFFFKPRYRTLAKPQMRLSVRNGCSTLERTLDLRRLVSLSASLKGLDSLLSMVQMPGGIPVATLAIGKPGAINAALFAVAILALNDPKTKQALDDFRANQTRKVAEAKLP